MDIRIHR